MDVATKKVQCFFVTALCFVLPGWAIMLCHKLKREKSWLPTEAGLSVSHK